MPALQPSKSSSVPRRHKLALVLIALAGLWIPGAFWPTMTTDKAPDWSGFASALASVSATMAGLTVALAAVLYALLGTQLVKFLHERGVLNRLLFDLMMSAMFWISAMALALLGLLPGFGHSEIAVRCSTSFTVSGILYFLPIGTAFWQLLRHSPAPPSPAISHDFNSPTKLS